MKIFIINGAQDFGHSKGLLNRLIGTWTKDFFESKGHEVKTTNVEDGYNSEDEVNKYVWADLIIYHTPVWWFSFPFALKKYIDEVFTAGAGNGIYNSDGRRSANPTRNYGTGGALHGRKYMLTTTWNAPVEAFTLPEEFFGGRSVDDGVMFGFHRMNAFIGLEGVPSYHFHDVMKNPNVEENEIAYKQHLDKLFS